MFSHTDTFSVVLGPFVYIQISIWGQWTPLTFLIMCVCWWWILLAFVGWSVDVIFHFHFWKTFLEEEAWTPGWLLPSSPLKKFLHCLLTASDEISNIIFIFIFCLYCVFSCWLLWKCFSSSMELSSLILIWLPVVCLKFLVLIMFIWLFGNFSVKFLKKLFLPFWSFQKLQITHILDLLNIPYLSEMICSLKNIFCVWFHFGCGQFFMALCFLIFPPPPFSSNI